MLRALREPGPVRNATRSPSTPIHTGTECGEPSGRIVARCAWFAPLAKVPKCPPQLPGRRCRLRLSEFTHRVGVLSKATCVLLTHLDAAACYP
jgi:hypothetical protein